MWISFNQISDELCWLLYSVMSIIRLLRAEELSSYLPCCWFFLTVSMPKYFAPSHVLLSKQVVTVFLLSHLSVSICMCGNARKSFVGTRPLLCYCTLSHVLAFLKPHSHPKQSKINFVMSHKVRLSKELQLNSFFALFKRSEDIFEFLFLPGDHNLSSSFISFKQRNHCFLLGP